MKKLIALLFLTTIALAGGPGYDPCIYNGSSTKCLPANIQVGSGSSVTGSELGFLSGVTSSVQTQLNGKQSTLSFSAPLVNSAGTVSINGSVATNKLNFVDSGDATKELLFDTSGQATSTIMTLAPQNSSALTLHIPQPATAGGSAMALIQDETTGFIFSSGISSSIGGANSMMQLANATTANRAQIKLHSYVNAASVAGVSTLTSKSGTIGVNNSIGINQDYSKWTAQAAATTVGSAPISGTWAFQSTGTINSLTVPSNYHIQLTNSAGTLADRWTLSSEGIIGMPGYTANTVPYLDGSKLLQSSAVTPTELGYVSGVTSAIQTQINAKLTLPSLTSGSVLFSDGSTIAQDNSNLFWDDTNNRLFVGSNPTNSGPGASGQLEIEATAGSDHAINIYTKTSNNAIEVQAQNANVAEFELSNDVAAGGAAITLERSRGTLGAKTQMKSGDVYGGLFFQGYTGSTFTGYGAAIAAVATQDITSSASGGQLVFTTSANGTNSGAVVKMVIDQNGTVEPGADASYDLGISAVDRWRNAYFSGVMSSGTLSVSGASTLTGAATLSSTLAVTGASTLTGAATLSSTLAVTGASTLTGNVTASGTLAVTGATTLSSLTAGSVPYAGTSGLISQANSNMFYASGTNTLMLGANSAVESLTNVPLYVASGAGTGIIVSSSVDGGGANQGNPKLIFHSSGGTPTAKTQTLLGATIGRVAFQGFNDLGAYVGTQVSFANLATENQTSTAFGSKYVMSRVATGTSTLRSNSWVWDNDGVFYDASQTPATANYGLLSVGSTTAAPQGGWDGAAAGHYVGSASGTMIAANGQSGYAGDLMNLEVAGVSEFKVTSAGNATVTGTLAVTGASTFTGAMTDLSTLSVTGATTVSGALAVNGAVAATNAALVYKNGHLKSTQTTAPTATVNANAGTGATCSVSNATDTAGSISLTTTAVAPGAGLQCAVNFNSAYGVAPKCQLQATNGNSILQSVLSGIYSSSTTAELDINFANTDAVGHAYTFDYLCIETQ